MNASTVSALVIRLFGLYNYYLAIDDIVYSLAKHASDPRWDSFRFYGLMIIARLVIGALAIKISIPLGKKIADGLMQPKPQD